MANRLPVVRKDGQLVQIPTGDVLLLRGGVNEAPVPNTSASGGVVSTANAELANTILIQSDSPVTGIAALSSGAVRRLTFDRNTTLTNSSTFQLFGGANIAARADDVATFRSLGSGTWKMIDYARADGTALVSSGGSSDPTKLPLAGGKMTGAINESDIQTLNATALSDVDLASLTSQTIRIVGPGPINSITNPPATSGATRRFLFGDDGTVIRHGGGNILLPGAANITSKSGDSMVVLQTTSPGIWRCVDYQRADGTALVSSGGTSPSSTDALPEGTTNLYFTNARARSATRFTWDQSTAMAVWTIPHNTNGYPSVTVVDTLGNVVTPDISYVDANTVQITHGAAYAGKAYIN